MSSALFLTITKTAPSPWHCTLTTFAGGTAIYANLSLKTKYNHMLEKKEKLTLFKLKGFICSFDTEGGFFW